jgi:Fe-S-cluster containining protein
MADELERQVERGSLYTHSALSAQAQRANESEAILNGLVDVLIRRRLVDADELLEAVDAARAETAAAGEAASAGVAIRVDPDSTATIAVDCEARLPVCHAVCCRLRFALTLEEVESGPLKWDLGRPYYNRHGSDGYCHACTPETHACTIYAERPTVCRTYSCANDPRIWTDFAAMELNQEWIDAHVGAEVPGPVEVFMQGYQAAASASHDSQRP